MRELLTQLLLFAAAATGYAAEDVALPYVVMKPHPFFTETVCGGREPCRVTGWYPGRQGAQEFPGILAEGIYLDDTLDPMADVFARSVLVHELVHHLQQQVGAYGHGIAPDCVSYVRSEAEAMLAQAQYLYEQHVPFSAAAAMAGYRCTHPTEGDDHE